MIKTSKQTLKEREVEYPRLRSLKTSGENELVVLFRCNDTGTVVLTNDRGRKLGYSYNDWDHRCFEDYNRGILLENI